MKRRIEMLSEKKEIETHMTPQELMAMAERLVALAREKMGKPAPAAQPRAGYKECPHCGETKHAGTGFGYKVLHNAKGEPVVKEQSWCRACRSSPDSHPGRQV